MQIDDDVLREVEAALAAAQSTVSDLCNPDEPTGSAIMVMYARCRAADVTARAALARLRKAMEGKDG